MQNYGQIDLQETGLEDAE